MTLVALYITFFIISYFIWIFIIISIWKQYRYATLLFDLLPFYPFLSIVAFVVNNISIILWLNVGAFYWVILATSSLLTGTLLFITLRWIRGYRFKSYEKLLRKLQEETFDVLNLAQFVPDMKNDSEKITVLIRHDVDLSLKRLEKMLALEKKYGFSSTALFRLHSEKYTFEEAIPVIEKLQKEGFDIGFHYEVLSTTNGDKSQAIELFSEELAKLRKISPVSIVAAHGDKFNNRSIWSEIDQQKLKVWSAYDMKKDLYLSDAGGYDLIGKFGHNLYEELAKVKKGDIVQILIHADWWF